MPENWNVFNKRGEKICVSESVSSRVTTESYVRYSLLFGLESTPRSESDVVNRAKNELLLSS